ncbi:MAG: hypothetical protein H6740_15200 [Alphaproteobacteria bacterium]|nr:hypothetical protein [Alphaproteobacteria bacterium]
MLLLRLVDRVVRRPFLRALLPRWILLGMLAVFLEKSIHPGLVRRAVAELPWPTATAWAMALGVALSLPLARAARPALLGPSLAFLHRQPLSGGRWSLALAPWSLALAAPVVLLSLLWPSEAQAAQAAAWGLAAGPACLAAAGPSGGAWALLCLLPWAGLVALGLQGPLEAWGALALGVGWSGLSLGPLHRRLATSAPLTWRLPTLALRPEGPWTASLLLRGRLLLRRAPAELLGMLALAPLAAVPPWAVLRQGHGAEAATLAAGVALGVCLLPLPALLDQSRAWTPPRAWPASPAQRAGVDAALALALGAPALLAAGLGGGAPAALMGLALAGGLGAAWLAGPQGRGPARPVNQGLWLWWWILLTPAWWASPGVGLLAAAVAALGLGRAHHLRDDLERRGFP